MIEYEVPNREGDGKGELIVLITTITDPQQAPTRALAQAYHQRWSTKPGTPSSAPACAARGRCCAPQKPDMIRQEICLMDFHLRRVAYCSIT